jgi:two-component system NarL family sensor kinase
LYPPALDEAGIEDAIRDYAKGFTNRSGIQVDLDLSPSVGRVGRDIELTVFRVVQEALTNVQRHSSGQRAKIRIYRNSNLTLEISDTGRGFSATAQKGKDERRFEFGVGIQSMRDRVNLIGGQLGIDSSSGGTTVRVTIPLGGEQP